MRILHVVKKYPNALGGDAIAVKNLEKQQKKDGNEVFILTTNCDEIINKKNLIKFGLNETPEKLDNITIKRILSLVDLCIKFPKIIKKIRPDIVHCHSIDLGYVISKASKKYNVPVIETLHGVSFNEPRYSSFKRKSELFFLKNSGFKKILTVDENSLQNLKKEGIENAIYTPNGVNLEEFRLGKRKENKEFTFLFVGRLEKQKGLDYLIEAVDKVKNLGLKFKLQIIGDGSESERLKEMSKELNLLNIEFLGKKNNNILINSYYSADAFILPSIWEGFPLTLLEAWASRLPVIVTNVGGISRVCKNNENALVIPSKDSMALVVAMEKIIKNSKLREKIAKNGRRLVEKRYNWCKINKKIEKIYNQ